jgi:hypothetical protein
VSKGFAEALGAKYIGEKRMKISMTWIAIAFCPEPSQPFSIKLNLGLLMDKLKKGKVLCGFCWLLSVF